jgi:hypothetical protein
MWRVTPLVLLILAGCIVWYGIGTAGSDGQAHDAPVAEQLPAGATLLVTAKNRKPKILPTLSVWQIPSSNPQEGILNFVSSRFPNLPDFACDSWCYESALDFVGATAVSGGRVEFRHRVRAHPNVIIVTTVTPEAGAVEFIARPEIDKTPGGELPSDLLVPNLCWQLKRAPDFASKPEPYPEFVKRCFIFTGKGRTFLDQTTRNKIPVRAADDPRNNPPWVQMYVGAWQTVPHSGPKAWSDYSPDQYTIPVIGTVSRDGKYLAAIASESPDALTQAWHDCMHNNPHWISSGGPDGKRIWRVKIYAMQNDPDALLARVAKDFPKVQAAGEARNETSRVTCAPK